MKELPTIVKILQFLRTKKAGTREDINILLGDSQRYAEKALTKLVQEGIIVEHEGSYSYNITQATEELCQKLFLLYDKVLRHPQKELLVRALLSQPGYPYFLNLKVLLDLLKEEGFTEQETAPFLEQEIKREYLKLAKIIFISRTSPIIPSYIPSHYMVGFKRLTTEEYHQLKEICQTSGLKFQEGSYLAENYPPEIKKLAKQYLELEKPRVKRAFRERIFAGIIEEEDSLGRARWYWALGSYYTYMQAEIWKGWLGLSVE